MTNKARGSESGVEMGRAGVVVMMWDGGEGGEDEIKREQKMDSTDI